MEDRKIDNRKAKIAAVLLVLIIATAFGLRIRDAWRARTPLLTEVLLRGRTFTVEVADTEEKKERGLGRRDALQPDRGMYFPFPSASRWVFWMKDMRFPIDIVWIRDGTVIDIDAFVPVSQSEDLETYSPVEPADAVLELNAGAVEDLGVRIGDQVLLRAL